jgi:hypothetical protein
MFNLVWFSPTDAFQTGLAIEIHGTPKDLDAARDLATRDKYQFQWWAVSLVEAQPFPHRLQTFQNAPRAFRRVRRGFPMNLPASRFLQHGSRIGNQARALAIFHGAWNGVEILPANQQSLRRLCASA